VWVLPPDPVRLKAPVAHPTLRIGQLRAVQRAAYFQPMGRRRVFILDEADTMKWNVASVFLKILEEPPGSATLILTAPSPYSLLPTIVSRCLQFHFAPLPTAEVEAILKEKSDLTPAAVKLAASFLKAARAGTGNGRRKREPAPRAPWPFWSARHAVRSSRKFLRRLRPSPRTAKFPSTSSSPFFIAC